MRFQPGHSGNPAGRPPGSLNKTTLAAQEALAERGEEIVTGIMDRAKNGEPAAMRLCMERLAPTGRNRPIAIDLPVIRTPEDAQAAVGVVTAALAAGKLSISEASGFIALIDRMLRLAERMWKFEQARRFAALREAMLFGRADGEEEAADDAQTAPADATQAPETPGEAGAPLYSPVNSGVTTDGDAAGASSREAGSTLAGAAPQEEAPPLPRAA